MVVTPCCSRPRPLTLHLQTECRCGAELKTALAADLLAGRDPPALAALLAEDESLVTQRAHLQRQRDTLQAALRLMRSLGPDSGAM